MRNERGRATTLSTDRYRLIEDYELYANKLD